MLFKKMPQGTHLTHSIKLRRKIEQIKSQRTTQAPFLIAIIIFELKQSLEIQVRSNGKSQAGKAFGYAVALGREGFYPSNDLLIYRCQLFLSIGKSQRDQSIDHQQLKKRLRQAFGARGRLLIKGIMGFPKIGYAHFANPRQIPGFFCLNQLCKWPGGFGCRITPIVTSEWWENWRGANF